MYEIETDVPLPKSPNKYPFATLGVGESFVVPYDDQPGVLVANRVCSAARAASRTHSMKFTTRRMNVGVRVWRVS